jgi:hypothetical protein
MTEKKIEDTFNEYFTGDTLKNTLDFAEFLRAEIAWAIVVKCGNCADCNHDPGKTEMIFKKKFANVCNGTDSLAMRFVNPDSETVECAKKMIDMRKYAIDNPI